MRIKKLFLTIKSKTSKSIPHCECHIQGCKVSCNVGGVSHFQKKKNVIYNYEGVQFNDNVISVTYSGWSNFQEKVF